MMTPSFWYQPAGPLARALTPASMLWQAGAALRRAVTQSVKSPVPVLCVGNLVVGGAGKTPITMDLVARLRARGVMAASLSRGHGGEQSGPLRVDALDHRAVDVGDEPLLLAQYNPAWIGRDRGRAALAMAEAGVGAIILDDGMQNPTLHQDLTMLVVDAATGFGNGRIIPAGPLREDAEAGLARAHAVVLMGDGPGPRSLRDRPTLRARLVPDAGIIDKLRGRRVLAFAGIGRPRKFFDMLASCGVILADCVPFADHYRLDPTEMASLLLRAQSQGAIPVTTEKDAMRLPPAVRQRLVVVPVRVGWEDEPAVEQMLDLLMEGRHGQP